MSDDRLLAALQRLGREELAPASDRAIRGRLETAWSARAREIQARGFSIRRLAPVLASLVLVAGLGVAVLGAGADSPLWDTRVALEDVRVALQSGDDRIAYLLDLVQARTEEAARQEAAGHAAAAAKARAASASAVAALGPDLPQVDPVVVTASPSPVSTAANSPSPSRSASGVPAVQLPSSPPPTATPARTAPPTPVHTVAPTPVPSATKIAITITGMVKDPSGAPVTDACITTSATVPTSTTACATKTKNGSYGISSTSVSAGQSITLYAYWLNATGQMHSASATATATSPTTVMPTMYLTLRK